MKPLRIGEIDYDKELPKVDLFLCKPDGTTISKISEAYDITYTTKLSVVDELSFKIPTKIEKDRAFIHNPHIDMTKPRYLIKMINNQKTEYFLLTQESKNASNSGKYISFSVFGLGYELIDKTIRRLEIEGKTLPFILNEVLSTTLWTVGYIDTDFYLQDGKEKTRTFDIVSQTVLQAVYDLAKRYNAIIRWNTRERKVSFFKPQDVGSNKGLRFKEGRLLESADVKIDSTETITRLKPYGKDGLTISSVNPTGMPYIESFDWYDNHKIQNGVIVQSSDYFPQDLTKALKDYKQLLKDHEGEFALIVESLNTAEDNLNDVNSRIRELETELKIAWDAIDVSNASIKINEKLEVEDYPEEHWELVAKKDRLELELKEEKLAQSKAETQVEEIEDELEELKDLLSRDNNFTREQVKTLVQFTIEKEYVNDSIEDPQDLYEEALKVFNEMNKPRISARIGIVNFLEVIEMQHDWHKLNLGDDVYISEKDLELSIKAKITEIIYNFENKDISLVIENEMQNPDDILDKIEQGSAGSAIIGHDKWEWNLSKENNGMINDIINSHWDATKQAIEAGYKQLITIDERGIKVESPDEECKAVIIQAGRIALTQDCGNTWKTAINPDGIWAEYLWGKVISGVNLIIEDESGVWITQGSRTTIYDRNQEEVMRLGLVSDEGDRDCFGIKSWNNYTQVELTDCLGFAISKWEPEDEKWDKVFWAMPDGTLVAKNLVAQGLKIVNSIGDYIIDAENDFMDLGALENILVDLVITPMEKLELGRMLVDYYEMFRNRYKIAVDYYFSSRDYEYDFEGAYNTETGQFETIHVPNDKDGSGDFILSYFHQVTQRMSRVLDIFSPFIVMKRPVMRPMQGVHSVIDPHTGANLAPDFFPESLEIYYHDESMKKNSEINKNQRSQLALFVSFYLEAIRDFDKQLEDIKFYSGLQMGRYYNNVIIDDHGFIAVRNDGKYRAYLNATHGLALQKWEDGKWRSKLFATLGHPDWEDGTLYAEGLVTKNLRIVDGDLGDKIVLDHEEGITIYGNNGEVIRLNGNVGINIHVKGEKRVWIGNDGLIYAKKLYIMGEDEDTILEDIDGSYISDLTVNKLKTLGHHMTTQDIIHIERNFIHLNTWYSNQEKTKMRITFEGTGEKSYPLMEMGAGIGSRPWGGGTEKARIYKDSDKLAIEYDTPTNPGLSKLYFNDTDTDNEKQAIYMHSGGGIRFESDNKIVVKVDEQQFLRLIKQKENVMRFGKSFLTMKEDSFIIQFGNNLIKLDESGVTIAGKRINLN